MSHGASALEAVELSNEVVARCHNQAEALESLGVSVGQLSSSLEVIQARQTMMSERMREAANETYSRCSDSEKALAVSLEALAALRGQLESSLAAVQTMREQVLKRSAEVETIAFQSKMLSLNASVEAARVGHAGAGFSVVAKEMSRLAQTSRETADEIRLGVTSTDKALTAIEVGIRGLTVQQQELALRLQEGLRGISGAVRDVMVASEDSQEVLAREERTAVTVCAGIKRSVEDNSRFLAELIGELTGVKIANLDPKACHASLKWLTVIDVRRQDEFNDELGHIEGARSMTLGDPLKSQLRTLDPNCFFLFVCRSGGRSARAARLAQAAGLHHIANLEGGMLAWNKAGLPVSRQV